MSQTSYHAALPCWHRDSAFCFCSQEWKSLSYSRLDWHVPYMFSSTFQPARQFAAALIGAAMASLELHLIGWLWQRQYARYVPASRPLWDAYRIADARKARAVQALRDRLPFAPATPTVLHTR